MRAIPTPLLAAAARPKLSTATYAPWQRQSLQRDCCLQGNLASRKREVGSHTGGEVLRRRHEPGETTYVAGVIFHIADHHVALEGLAEPLPSQAGVAASICARHSRYSSLTLKVFSLGGVPFPAPSIVG